MARRSAGARMCRKCANACADAPQTTLTAARAQAGVSDRPRAQRAEEKVRMSVLRAILGVSPLLSVFAEH